MGTASKVFLHIGFPRTGSTFLQQKLFPQLRQTTLYRGINFQYNQGFNKVFFASEALYNEAEAKAAAQSLKGDQILISNEMLVGRTHLYYLDQSLLARRLSRIFPGAIVILVIRNQLDLLRSVYCKFVEARKETRSFEDFLWFPKKDNKVTLNETEQRSFSNEYLYFNPYENRQHLDWYIFDNTIDLYKKCFQKVVVLLYEELEHEPVKFINKLENVLGEKIKSKKGSNNSLYRNKINKSFNQQQLYWYRKLNSISNLFSPKSSMQNLIWELKMWIKYKVQSNNTFKVSLPTRLKITSYYQPHNVRLARKYPELSLNRFKNAYFLEE